MRTGARLALYGAGLLVAFGGALGLAAAVAPDDVAAGSVVVPSTDGHDGAHDDAEGNPASESTAVASALKGLAVSIDGLTLSRLAAPAAVGETGMLSFRIDDAEGVPVTSYATAHDRDLHLIVVRSDGSGFRHVHPRLDDSGTWSIPWEWTDAGTYRVFADFTPADAANLTLSRTVDVAGAFAPRDPQPARIDEVAGFTVSLDGQLVAGKPEELIITVSRDGEPVTALEPYLGAFGHLVALRQGDLAFLHVHAEGDEPAAGDSAGPEIAFLAEAPTAGRYLLYLDFQLDGIVHTAEFVVDADHGGHS